MPTRLMIPHVLPVALKKPSDKFLNCELASIIWSDLRSDLPARNWNFALAGFLECGCRIHHQHLRCSSPDWRPNCVILPLLTSHRHPYRARTRHPDIGRAQRTGISGPEPRTALKVHPAPRRFDQNRCRRAPLCFRTSIERAQLSVLGKLAAAMRISRRYFLMVSVLR